MNLPARQFYNPLDESQIEFIPSDSESSKGNVVRTTNDSLDGSSDKESIGDHSLFTKDHTLSSRRGSITMSELISNSLKQTQSIDSPRLDSYALSRMSSSTSLSSSVIDRVRYKIVLRLNPREKSLLRESWSMILNEDIASPPTKTGSNGKKTHLNHKTHAVDSQKRRSRQSSASSINSAVNVAVETKGNAHSNAFASSLFCSQFYANLLSMDPDLERIFSSTRHQAVAFAGVLTAAIKNLENLQALEGFLESLGKRHARILNIEPPHFETMGVAFLKTLQDRFGVHCTIELEEVWSRLYSYLANSILQFGIDPYLQVDLQQDTLVFPVPNLQTGASQTVSRLSSRISLSDSLRSGAFTSTRDDHVAEHRDRKASTKTAAPASDKKTGHSSTSKKAQAHRNKNKKASKLNFSSNQDCVVM
ncbi:hypothetical protein HG536_0D00270 [Torulaspora globosa]|uniref:Globin domain-containing protein n=1 Tax=Torulaspora globosa TaxID=48254 RepID=A0A7G3ZG69_9SACH|nr:uncharacterized protein HG536_0D00270 [Torulaspora globosa]QLL32505.1 hypothetical protein HG536_0D00270 [Torulaspora globosa]